jgi:hypothetical protein
MNDLTAELTKEMERDLSVKLTGNRAIPSVATTSMGVPKVPTHTARIDELIGELQMTIRILEEAKKRLY